MTPSCMVDATNSPCLLNICPRTRPRPLLAVGYSRIIMFTRYYEYAQITSK
jgi:hypothetical protein